MVIKFPTFCCDSVSTTALAFCTSTRPSAIHWSRGLAMGTSRNWAPQKTWPKIPLPAATVDTLRCQSGGTYKAPRRAPFIDSESRTHTHTQHILPWKQSLRSVVAHGSLPWRHLRGSPPPTTIAQRGKLSASRTTLCTHRNSTSWTVWEDGWSLFSSSSSCKNGSSWTMRSAFSSKTFFGQFLKRVAYGRATKWYETRLKIYDICYG